MQANPDYIAHELGHGAFSLQHVWAEWPGIAQHSTRNLMDYSYRAQGLWKPQWEMMRNQKWRLNWFDDAEEGMIRYDDPDCWSGKSIIWLANTPQLYKGKKILKFDAACACNNYGNERTYYRLSDGNIFRVTTVYDGYGNVESTRYAIKLPQTEFINFPLDRLPNDCLSCDFSELSKQILIKGTNYSK